jgi:hypothetical protein
LFVDEILVDDRMGFADLGLDGRSWVILFFYGLVLHKCCLQMICVEKNCVRKMTVLTKKIVDKYDHLRKKKKRTAKKYNNEKSNKKVIKKKYKVKNR